MSPGFEPCHAGTWRKALVVDVGCILNRGDAGADGSTPALIHTG
jgi:hypothetical protein